jgi:hypothetical protein
VLVLAMVQAKSLKKRKPKGLLPVPAELRA